MKGDRQEHEVNTFSMPLQLAKLGELVDERLATIEERVKQLAELVRAAGAVFDSIRSIRSPDSSIDVRLSEDGASVDIVLPKPVGERVAQIDIERVDERCNGLAEDFGSVSEMLVDLRQALGDMAVSESRIVAVEARFGALDAYIKAGFERPVVSSDAPVVLGGAMLLPGVHREVDPAEDRSDYRWGWAAIVIGAVMGSAVGVGCTVLVWWMQ